MGPIQALKILCWVLAAATIDNVIWPSPKMQTCHLQCCTQGHWTPNMPYTGCTVLQAFANAQQAELHHDASSRTRSQRAMLPRAPRLKALPSSPQRMCRLHVHPRICTFDAQARSPWDRQGMSGRRDQQGGVRPHPEGGGQHRGHAPPGCVHTVQLLPHLHPGLGAGFLQGKGIPLQIRARKCLFLSLCMTYADSAYASSS